MPQFDWLVVGAGFTGAVFAERLASQTNAKVLVIDRRDHAAGNAFDFTSQSGILVHAYGPHIFHTKSQVVWNYVSKFTEWRPYDHEVRAKVEDQFIPIPFNINSIHMMLSRCEAKEIEKQLVTNYGNGAEIPVLTLIESPIKKIRELGEKIYDWVFIGYNQKQWGLRPEELDRSVTRRVPVRISRNNSYFLDAHQGIPVNGYANLINSILAHPNITLTLNTDYSEVGSLFRPERTVYTGSLDELFGRCFGALPYRSLEFENRIIVADQGLPVAQVNYPSWSDGSFTREVEHKQITGQISRLSVITREFPRAHEPGINDAYYPVLQSESRELHGRYKAHVLEKFPGMVLAGRLADFRYYNMDQAVSNALIRVRRLILVGSRFL